MMAVERMDIEDFSKNIDPDLLKYASAFRKSGFTSSVTMKYWRQQDFQNLEVEVPEGHRWLILNMVTKIHTPNVKSERKLSSLTERQPDESPRKRRREISATFNAFHDEPSSSGTQLK